MNPNQTPGNEQQQGPIPEGLKDLPKEIQEALFPSSDPLEDPKKIELDDGVEMGTAGPPPAHKARRVGSPPPPRSKTDEMTTDEKIAVAKTYADHVIGPDHQPTQAEVDMLNRRIAASKHLREGWNERCLKIASEAPKAPPIIERLTQLSAQWAKGVLTADAVKKGRDIWEYEPSTIRGWVMYAFESVLVTLANFFTYRDHNTAKAQRKSLARTNRFASKMAQLMTGTHGELPVDPYMALCVEMMQAVKDAAPQPGETQEQAGRRVSAEVMAKYVDIKEKVDEEDAQNGLESADAIVNYKITPPRLILKKAPPQPVTAGVTTCVQNIAVPGQAFANELASEGIVVSQVPFAPEVVAKAEEAKKPAKDAWKTVDGSDSPDPLLRFARQNRLKELLAKPSLDLEERKMLQDLISGDITII